MLGPAGYASAGAPDEPGTVLLTVGGSVARPAVVETPSGEPLGHILDICQASPAQGVLVGGYHGMWLTPEAAYNILVSRAGLAAAGGILGAGVVLVLGEENCPLSEVARVAGYMAGQSSGQCGPCKLGLPAVAKSLADITAGSGGLEQVEAVRRTAGGIRGRGACHHPDGTGRFVTSALDVFAADLSQHLFRGNCGRPARGVLPLPAAHGETQLAVDWTRCEGHGLCARLVPELVQLDGHGYPEFLDAPVPFWLSRDARQAVDMCPALALSLTRVKPELGRLALPPPARVSVPDLTSRSPGMPGLTKRAKQDADLSMTTAWIAALGDGRPG
jgi:ferredoxin